MSANVQSPVVIPRVEGQLCLTHLSVPLLEEAVQIAWAHLDRAKSAVANLGAPVCYAQEAYDYLQFCRFSLEWKLNEEEDYD